MVSFWGRKNGGEEEEERKEKKKKKKEEEEAKLRYGSYGFCMELMNLYGIMCILTMVGTSMVSKPRFLLGFHPNPRINESKVGKNPKWYKKNMESSL